MDWSYSSQMEGHDNEDDVLKMYKNFSKFDSQDNGLYHKKPSQGK